jgi:hypothetical protein
VYDITPIDDFKLFCASRRAQEVFEPRIRAANRANAEYLAAHPPEPQAMPITGAFICAHAPNYLGRPALDWGGAEWRGLFRRFRELGLDTAVFQAALWNELQECYYPSKAFSSFKIWNVIEPMLEAASEEKIRVFLGGYGSTTGLSEQEDEQTMAREQKACIDCLSEIMEYRAAFDGFYFSSETAFMGSYNPRKIKRLNRIYRGFFEHIKSTDASLRILMSPGTKYFPGKEQEMADSWLEMLDGVPLDILAPQDSIGTCGNELRHAEAMYRVWNTVCAEREIVFWSNIEIFQRGEDLSLLDHSVTADPERVVAQINLAAPFAEKLLCWEAPYYLCDPGNPRAAALARAVFSGGAESRVADGQGENSTRPLEIMESIGG